MVLVSIVTDLGQHRRPPVHERESVVVVNPPSSSSGDRCGDDARKPDVAQNAADLAETQRSLRRLATLIARGAPPEEVFAATTNEALRHFGSGTARMIRFELDGTATLLANAGSVGPHVRVDEQWTGYPATGLTATVRNTGRAARVDSYYDVPGGDPYVQEGLTSAVGMPIHVDGRLWGLIAVGSGSGPLPPDTEQRMTEFTDLIATAVANAQSRAELMASRQRLVAASDDIRRRIERDLHDGAQQRLVALALRLRTLSENVHDANDVRSEFAAVSDELLGLTDDLREIAHGIFPANLSRSGLGPTLRALGRRSAVPAQIAVQVNDRLPESIETAAYYVVSEALVNAAKHAGASVVQIDIRTVADALRIDVRDDGVGGANPECGSGLTGLRDRVEALGGTLVVTSPVGQGTTIRCEIATGMPTESPAIARPTWR